ncbi:MAG: hypothetical protein QM482_00785 [Sulfurospirillum sp.]
MKFVYIILWASIMLFGSSCADQYSNENYTTASQSFGDEVGGSLKKYFGKDMQEFKEFEKTGIQEEIYYLKKGFFVRNGDNYYPVKDGVWKLHADKNSKIDALDIAKNTLYQDSVEDIANDLNSDMDNLWAKWGGDAYGHYMVPEYVQIHYNNFYISLKANIYGSEGDSTGLKKAFLDFYIINNTDEVNRYVRCSKSIKK